MKAYRYILLVTACAALSCTKGTDPVDDIDTSAPYVRFSEELERVSFTAKASTLTVEMYTNQGPWVVEPAFTEDNDWLSCWPKEGDRNGRFTVAAAANEGARVRTGTIQVVVAGQVIKSFDVQQLGTDPSILLDMGSDRVSSPAAGGEITVSVVANTIWKAVIPDEVDWIALGAHTDESQVFIVDPNTGDERTAVIRLQAVGTSLEGVYTDVTIAQFDQSKDPHNGRKVTVADIYAKYPGGIDVIDENLWVAGTVTSDRSKLNFEPEQMYIQDGSGRGLRVDFNAVKDNVFLRGTEVSLHLYGLRVAIDAVTGLLRIAGASSASIFESTPDAGEVDPVAVGIADLDAYQNTLVKIDNLSFTLPFGTYVNVDDRYYSWVNTTYKRNTSALPYCDGDDFAGQMLMDADGRTVRLYCRSRFLDRHCRTMPAGKGSITGIVSRYEKAGKVENILLIRDDADNGVDDGESLLRTLTRIGPVTSTAEAQRIMSSDGHAQIKTSWTEAVAGFGTTNGVVLDLGWSYMRKAPATVTLKADGSQSWSPTLVTTIGGAEDMYLCISSQHFWNYTGSTLNREGAEEGELGEAWIFPVSGLDVDASKPLYLVFTTSASQTGPMYFDMEWSLAEDDDMTAFKAGKFGEYICPDWYSSHQLEQFVVRLPEELKTLGSFVIRFRTTRDWRAGNGMTNGAESATSISTGGAPRIGIWEIIQPR